MHYLLNISPEEAAERLNGFLIGPVSEAKWNITGRKPPYGYYGFADCGQFSITLHDSSLAPSRTNARLEGKIRPHPSGCEITARYRSMPLLWLIAALWLVVAVIFLLSWYSMPREAHSFFAFWAIACALLLAVWARILRRIPARYFRDFEQLFSDAIAEKREAA